MKFSIHKETKFFLYLLLDLNNNKSCLFPFGFRLDHSLKKGIRGWKLQFGFLLGIISLYNLFPEIFRDCISTGFNIWFFPKLYKMDSYELCWRFNYTNFWKSIIGNELRSRT